MAPAQWCAWGPSYCLFMLRNLGCCCCCCCLLRAAFLGCSYYDIMLAPLADAVRDALAITAKEETLTTLPGRKRPVVYFAMQVGQTSWQNGPVPQAHTNNE